VDELINDGLIEDASKLSLEVALPSPISHRFLDLLNELRLAIWEFALEDMFQVLEVREAVNRGDDPARPMFLPSLCYTSKKTFEETMAVMIENMEIQVCSIMDNDFIRAFLAAGPDRFRLVRQLNFDYFSRFPAEKFEKNADLELAVDCKGLRTIKLGFHQTQLTYSLMVDQWQMRFKITPHPADKLFSKYRLERLLECDKLSTIIIEHFGTFMEAAEEAAENLGKLLEQKFASKGQKQVVEVQYTPAPQQYRSSYYYHY
jgi:hypothetical protein